MGVNRIDVTSFLNLATEHLIIDVRSPAEFEHAHIPKAFSLPLFTNDQRKVVGTTYKQQSREEAIKIGLDYFGPNMKSIVVQVEQLLQKKKYQNGFSTLLAWRNAKCSHCLVIGFVWL
jgi:tRNA 2-selenouridine synthase